MRITRPTVHVDHLIIGGGVVGLAIGARLSQLLLSRGQPLHHNSSTPSSTTATTIFGRPVNVLLIERHPYLANEASSRNSEVVHAGLYYPPQSLKMKYCLQGRRLLYDFCERFSVPYKRVGKWLISTTPGEHEQLRHLYDRLQSTTAHNDYQLRWLPREEWKAKEPRLAADRIHSVLESPQSGIVDSHGLISALEAQMLESPDALISLNTTAGAPILDAPDNFYRTPVTITRPATPRRPQPLHEQLIIKSRTVINSAGLWADQIAGSLRREKHPETPLIPATQLADYEIHPCKGHYYALSTKSPVVSRLIYPIPDPNLRHGLGIHLTPDMSGRIRLGPDAEYFDPQSPTGRYDYTIDDEGTSGELVRRRRFMESVQRYLQLDPQQDWDRMRVDYSSVRCKLRMNLRNGKARDFIVRDESEFGAPGFINLIGIESPGLTASLAIAKDVVDRIMQPYL